MTDSPPRSGSARLRALLGSVPQDARRVIERGAGDSGLADRYRARNPTVDYVTRALVEDLPPDTQGGPGPADVLVYPDALARANDPAAHLLADRRALSDDGTVVAVVPNAQHWRRLRRALTGDWDYDTGAPLGAPQGKAFTPEIVREMLRRAGLHLTALHPVGDPDADPATADAAIQRLAQARDTDVERMRRRCRPEAFVVVATARERPRLLLQAMTLRPQGACIEVRVDEPMAALASRPEVRVRVERQKAQLDRTAGADAKIFFWQRPILTWDQLANVRRVIDAGYLVVTEFDDHPMRWPQIAENDHLSFAGVHAVQTSTPALAQTLRAFNPVVGTFPNGVASLPPAPEAVPPDQPLRVFFGALNREDDWAPMLAGVNAVLRRHGGRLHVEVIHDRAFFDALETDAKTFTPTCGYETYKAVLGRCQIALMPLAAGTFNRMKSDLKFVEAAAHGAVALASPTVYADTIRDGETGVICRTDQEFADALEALAGDPERRLRIARAAWRWVRDNRMHAYQIAPRLAWYRELLTRRQELTEALYQRVPRLRG